MDYNLNNVEVFIRENFNRNAVEIWVIEHCTDGDYNISYKNKNIIKTKYPDTAVIDNQMEPFLSLQRGFYEFISSQIIENNFKKGLRTKGESYFEGQLKLMTEHIQYMKDVSAQDRIFIQKLISKIK